MQKWPKSCKQWTENIAHHDTRTNFKLALTWSNGACETRNIVANMQLFIYAATETIGTSSPKGAVQSEWGP